MNLKHFRSTHGLTQAQLAKLLGVSKIAVAKREQAGTVPNVMVLAIGAVEKTLKLKGFEETHNLASKMRLRLSSEYS